MVHKKKVLLLKFGEIKFDIRNLLPEAELFVQAGYGSATVDLLARFVETLGLIWLKLHIIAF